MSLFVVGELPARLRLSDEGIPLRDIKDAPQDTLHIGVLNLMPLKEDSETDLLRAFSTSPIDLKFTWHTPRSHASKTTPWEHLDRFYTHLLPGSITDLDALIITGAPVEKLPYDQVDYMSEFCDLIDEASQRAVPLLLLCWAAFAGIYHLFGIDRTILTKKISGVFDHSVNKPESPLMNGIESPLYAPQSRFVTLSASSLSAINGLDIIASSLEVGLHIAATKGCSAVFITGHGEYAVDTLHKEYLRDSGRGLSPSIPLNYYEANDPKRKIINRWQPTGRKIFNNWIEAVVAPSSRQKPSKGYHPEAQEP